MKKLLYFSAMFFLLSYNKINAQTMSITNYSETCDVVVGLYAHDMYGASCGSNASYPITIPAYGGSVYISAPTNLNSPGCTPVSWATGGSIGSGAAWDMAKAYVSCSGCTGFIGAKVSPCYTSSTYYSGSPCCIISSTWYDDGSGNITIAFQ